MPPPPKALVEDQWLPEKLARVGIFIEIEKGIYAAYKAMITDWLDTVVGAVLTATGIDPLGIYAFATAWDEFLDKFVGGSIMKALGKAYEFVLGESYAFSNRPFVQRYIQDSRNRLVRTRDDVYEEIKKSVAKGTSEGQSIPEIAASIKKDLLDSGSPYWRNRAVTVARTETIGAYNGGANDAFSEIVGMFPEDEYEKIWLATDDSRTRPTHNHADGQRVAFNQTFDVGGFPMAFPGDPAGPAQEVINCRCTMLLVEKGEIVDYSNKGFKGMSASAVARPKPLTAPALVAAALPQVSTDFAALLAAAWISNDWKLHATCATTFCRNPLHPGPCKGWKHTLKKVAPGAYDALEKARIEKLEAKKKAKIKALQEAGKPIPKSLLKPIKKIEPKPGPVDPDPNQPPLSQATEDKLKKVSEKVKDAFSPKPPAGSTPAKVTLGQAGLSVGDKAWFYGTGKTAGKPQLVTVANAKGLPKKGSLQETKSYKLVGANNEEVATGAANAKFWLSPETGGKFGPKDGDGDGKVNEGKDDEGPAAPKAAAPAAAKALDLANNWQTGDLHRKDFITAAEKISKEEFDALPEDDRKTLMNRVSLISNGVGGVASNATALKNKWAGTAKPAAEYVPQHIKDVKNALAGNKSSGLPDSLLYSGVSKASWEKSFTKEERAAAHAKLKAVQGGKLEDAEGKKVAAAIADLESIDPDLAKSSDLNAPVQVKLSEVGLKDGDKITVFPKPLGDGYNINPAEPGPPMLVTVKKTKGAGKAINDKADYQLVAEDGTVVDSGWAAAKMWMASPDASTPAASTPDAPESDITPAANMAANVAFAPDNYTKAERLEAYDALSQDDVDSLNTQDTSNLIDDLLTMQADGLSPGEKKIFDKTWDLIEKQSDGNGMTISTSVDKPSPGKSEEAKISMNLINNNAKPGTNMDHGMKITGATTMTKADFDTLSDEEKQQVNDILSEMAHPVKFEFLASLKEQKLAKEKFEEYNGKPLAAPDSHTVKPTSSVDPDAIATLSPTNKAAVDKAQDIALNGYKYGTDEALSALGGLSKADWDSLDVSTQKSLVNKLKTIANGYKTTPEQKKKAATVAADLGNSYPLGSSGQVAAVQAIYTGTDADVVQAGSALSKDEFIGLAETHQTAIKNAITSQLKETDGADWDNAADAAKYLLGITPKPPAAVSLPSAPPPYTPNLAPPTPKAVQVYDAINGAHSTEWNKWEAVQGITKDDWKTLPLGTKGKTLQLLDKVAKGEGDKNFFAAGDMPKANAIYKSLVDKDAPGYTPAPTPKAQKTIDDLNNLSSSFSAFIGAQEMSKADFDSLPEGDQGKLLTMLNGIYSGNDQSMGFLDPATKQAASDVHQKFSGKPAPGVAGTVGGPSASEGTGDLDNPAAAVKKNPDNSFAEWQAAKQKVNPSGYTKNSTAYKVAKQISSGTVNDRLTAYSGNVGDKKKFEALPVEIQDAIIADLDNIHAASGGFFTDGQKIQADGLREAFTGAPPLTLFTPKVPAPKKAATPKKPKFSSDAQANAYEAAMGNADTGKPMDRLHKYMALTQDEFLELPATAQKNLVKDLGNMAYAPYWGSTEYTADFGGGSNAGNKGFAKATLIKLIGTDTAKGFKPKTKAQKEYEKLGDSMFEPMTDSDGNLVSNAAAIYDKKIATAAKGAQALSSAPADMMKAGVSGWDSSGAWKQFSTPQHPGSQMYEAVQSYKGSGYHPINDGLRDAKGDVTKMSGTWRNYINAMDDLYAQSKLTSNIQTLRGFDNPAKVFKPEIWNDGKTDLTGMEWTEHGYSSTSTSKGIAENFAGVSYKSGGKPMTPADGYQYEHAKNRIVLSIFTPKGHGAVKVSGPEYEYEVLLNRGTRYRVVRDNGVVDGARRLDVEVIG